MFEFIVKWTDRARSLVKANIIWNSSSHLQEQIRMYQVNYNAQKSNVYITFKCNYLLSTVRINNLCF